ESQAHARRFLDHYANHEHAAGVALLIAENDYVGRRLPQALAGYRAFLADYASSPLAPTAQFRLGLTLYQLEKFDEAAATLRPIAESAGARPEYRLGW